MGYPVKKGTQAVVKELLICPHCGEETLALTLSLGSEVMLKPTEVSYLLNLFLGKK
jgi:hypothetical protein